MKSEGNISQIPAALRAELSAFDPQERDDLISAWALAGEMWPSVVVNTDIKDEVRATVLRSIKLEADKEVVYPRLRLLRRPYAFRSLSIAAVIIVLVATSFLLNPSGHTIRVPIGQQTPSVVQLPDGSTVSLAAGSRLSYTDAFGEYERRITMRGEAYLDIVKDRAPFLVDTYNARTSVIGTKFSVRSWPDEIDAATEVGVIEGLVSVSNRRNSLKSVMLSPGMRVAAVEADDYSSFQPVKTNTARALAWMDGGFAYDNTPVGNVLSDLQRRFNVRLKAPTSIRLRRISYWKQSSAPVDEILDEISSTIGVRFRAISGGFELFLP